MQTSAKTAESSNINFISEPERPQTTGAAGDLRFVVVAECTKQTRFQEDGGDATHILKVQTRLDLLEPKRITFTVNVGVLMLK